MTTGSNRAQFGLERIWRSLDKPPESAYGLWYYPEINRFTDEDGFILHDLHAYFSVPQLDMWKKTKDYGIMIDRKGNLCELYYLED